MNSDQAEINNLFSLVIQTIFTKLSLEYKLSVSDLTNKIGFPTFNKDNDLETSIRSYCDRLLVSEILPSPTEKNTKPIKKNSVLDKMNAYAEPSSVQDTIFEQPIFTNQTQVEPIKQKKIIKKKAPEQSVTNIETPISVIETIVEPVKQKKIIKKKVSDPPVTIEIPVETLVENNAIPVSSETPVETVVEEVKQKKIIKKKASEPIVTNETPVEIPTEIPVEPIKQKKIIKKKAPETVVTATETPVEEVKQKKIIKKKTNEPLVDLVKTIHTEEDSEVKIKPKKNEPFVKKHIQSTENAEYGEEGDHSEVYESFQTYETDELQPKKINETNYYVDTSGYVYDFENQELLGKLNQSGDTVIFLTDFSDSK